MAYQYHIKRDGAWLCKADIGGHKFFYKHESHIEFSEAHRTDLEKTHCCEKCIKRYYEIVSTMNPQIIIET